MRAATRVDELRVFRGPPNEFWPALLETLAALAGGAEAAALVIPVDERGQSVAFDPAAARPAAGAPPVTWRLAWEWTARRLAENRLHVFRTAFRPVADAAAHAPDGAARAALTGAERSLAGDGAFLALRLETGGEGFSLALLLLPPLERAASDEAVRRLRLAADAPRGYGLARHLATAQREVEKLASALDLVALLDAERKFPAAAMTLCNELAARHQCQRVSLGWRRGPYLQLRAISHMEKFEARMTIVRQLEAAMEEAADQDTEIVLPPPAETTLITRDHALYAAEQKPGALCTLPLRVGSKGLAVGALTCERAEPAFSEHELRHLRLAADHAARRLDVLERAEAWWGKRAWRAARERLSGLLGAEHTLAKAGAIAGAVVLLWAVVWPMLYEVDAPFSLRGTEAAVASAPFDGYLAEGLVQKGDAVTAGTVLARLDQTELALELSAAQADETRYLREVQKARSERQLSEMQIAQARADQARARLDILRHRIEQSEVRAPFDGVIVEGDLRERAGAPLKQGDALFRVARLDRLYAEVLVREADVRDVAVGAPGEIAFASQPGRRFPVVVERIEPLAQTRPEGSVFLVRCTLPAGAEPWWRPGMTGVGRIEAGRRTPLWIATHRTLDYLRLRWW
jgi:RND family efflux transporter MFP subunit